MNVKLKALSTHRKFLGLRHPGFLEPFWSSPCTCQGFLTVQGECILSFFCYSKLAISVDVSINGCLSLCVACDKLATCLGSTPPCLTLNWISGSMWMNGLAIDHVTVHMNINSCLAL